MLSTDKLNEPFAPLVVFGDRRSIIPEDFTNAEIDFFAAILQSIANPLLKARLADLVWYVQVPRNVDFALVAIDSYRSLPLDADSWFSEGEKCWRRAISLNRMIGKAAGDRHELIVSSMIEALKSATEKDKFLGYGLADALMDCGVAQGHSTTVAGKLKSLAQEFDAAGNFYASGRYYNAAAKWFKGSNDKDQSIAMTVAEAEAFVKEATDRATSEEPSYLVAADFLEKAIQVYRSVPRINRSSHNVDQRIEDLRLRLNEYGERGLKELKTVTTPEVDVSKSVAQARASVSGKSMHDALIAFANLHSTNVENLRKESKESLSNTPFRALIPKVVTGDKGQVIAKTPGLSGSTPSTQDELEIRAEMNSHYQLLVSLVVQAAILPALNVITAEHRFREDDLIDLARRSPIVPRGREVLFGKALAQGFNLDFMTSLHLLAPQIEHMVRFHLKAAGVTTTQLTQDGIETENSLNALIYLPEALAIFKEDLTYEIKALFCEPMGPNLRNNIAHGLLDDQQCHSVYAVYAWWLTLKLVFSTFWNSLHRDPAEEDAPDTDGEPSA